MKAQHTPGEAKPRRLWCYTNLIGVVGWAESKLDFLKRYPHAKDGAVIVRCAHYGVKPPEGYEKADNELAFSPVTLAKAEGGGQ